MTGVGQEHAPLRANRDFTLFWIGQVVSTLGARVSSIAYPLLVLGLTGSAADVGVVAFAQSLPYLIWFLPAGALVDRWDRKRTMLGCDAVRILGLAVLAAALAGDRLGLPLILVVVFVEGTAFVFFELAEAAALPRIVPQHQMTTALATNQARVHGADLLGQPLGGALFAVGRAVPFVADACSYAVSLVTLLFVRPAFQDERGVARRRLTTEIREGVAWLRAEPFSRVVVVLIAGTNLAFNALTIVLIVRAESLGASPAVIGTMLAGFGAGAIAGALVAPLAQRRLPLAVLVIGPLWVWAAMLGALAVLRSPLLLGLVIALGATTGPVFNVAVSAYRYAIVPDELQGRVLSVVRAVAWGTIPLGGLLGGFSVEWAGPGPAFLVLGTIMVVTAAAATASPVVRRVTMPGGARP